MTNSCGISINRFSNPRLLSQLDPGWVPSGNSASTTEQTLTKMGVKQTNNKIVEESREQKKYEK